MIQMNLTIKIFFLVIVNCLLSKLYSDVKLPPLFTNGMVLQRNMKVPIWGKGDRDENIVVKFGGQIKKTIVDQNGDWKVLLDPLTSNSIGQNLTVLGGNKIILKDILVGEIWLAAGQSNMQWSMNKIGAKKEIESSENDQLRLLNFVPNNNFSPSRGRISIDNLKRISIDNAYVLNGWKKASSESVIDFSAVAYYFAKELQLKLNIPIGIINCSVGGSPTESFINPMDLASHNLLKELVGENWLNSKYFPKWVKERTNQNLSLWNENNEIKKLPNHLFKPGFLYKASINRIAPFALKGCVWYQGESNSPDLRGTTEVDYVDGFDIDLSRDKFHMLIKGWRKRWNYDFPFLYVQLPGLNRPWSLYREMQLQTLNQIPDTGMAVTYDVGHPINVHPKNKKTVGERLSLIARDEVYFENIVSTGPVYKSFTIEEYKIRIYFDYNEGIKGIGGDRIKGFEICGEDQKFYPAKAEIDNNDIILTSPKVRSPIAARYAWMNDPKGKCNLGNEAGLLASPFRTNN